MERLGKGNDFQICIDEEETAMFRLRDDAVLYPRRANWWLLASFLAYSLSVFSQVAWSSGNVLIVDHFNDESSLQNYEMFGDIWIENQKLFLYECPSHYLHCDFYGPGRAEALLKLDPQRNFDFTAKLQPLDVPQGFIGLHAAGFTSSGDPSYELYFGNSAGNGSGVPMQYDHMTLLRNRGIINTVAEANFSPVDIPSTARIKVNGNKIQVFLNGKQYLNYSDPDLLPPVHIGLGDSVSLSMMTFDDVVLKALPDLHCSADANVDGNDRICEGGLFENSLWGYLWPADNVSQVDFYLDGRFHRREFYPPWELEGGKAARLTTGPHEVRAKVRYKDGSKATLISAFEVGEHSLRCSPDPVLDGTDAACEGGHFTTPGWVYWWPETDVKSISFYLGTDMLHRTERKAPFELDGGAASLFQGFDVYSLRSVVEFKDGRKPLTLYTTAVWSTDSEQRSLLCSTDSVLDGTDLDCAHGVFFSEHLVRVYWWPQDGIQYVDYYLDGNFHRSEREAPFELDGGDWTELSPGDHHITSIAHFSDMGKPPIAVTTSLNAF